jgi:hypothetical protein
MILYIEDLFREINILNWYRGEAVKRGDANADLIQSNQDTQDALLYHLRNAVNDVLQFANPNRVRFTCKYEDDQLKFSISPVREGREYLLDVLKESIRQYLVFEVRRLWMMNIRPEWADESLRSSLRANILEAMNNSTSGGNKVRRRATTMGI